MIDRKLNYAPVFRHES